VIDDEDSIRSVVAMGLERLGYHVTLASSGHEALALFGEDPQRYDLVMLDMIMPNLSGPDVFRALVASDPSVKILVSSGYASSEALDDMKRLRNFDFIAKPFTIDELAAQVRRSLDD
jgi:two-component system cell cycle sensor histidine kinase/response regulator CckA